MFPSDSQLVSRLDKHYMIWVGRFSVHVATFCRSFWHRFCRYNHARNRGVARHTIVKDEFCIGSGVKAWLIGMITSAGVGALMWNDLERERPLLVSASG